MRKKEPTIEEVKAFYDDQHNQHQSKWLRKANPRLTALAAFAQSQIIKTKPESLLDVGCGVGILTKQLAELVQYIVAIDLSDANIKTAKAHNSDDRITYIPGDFSRMYLNNKFDIVCLFDVVEHIRPSDRKIFLMNVKKHCNKLVLVSIPDPVVLKKYKKTRPQDLQIVDEPVYDKVFDMFTLQHRISAGKYIYYILSP